MKNLNKYSILFLALLLGSIASIKAQDSSEDANNGPIAGTDCSAFGWGSLDNNTTGAENSALGHTALNSNTAGSRNSAGGKEALFTSNADDNTAFGYRALYLVTSDANAAVGSEALGNTTGSENSGAGYQVLMTNVTGNLNSGLGSMADVQGANNNNQTIIGYAAMTSATAMDDIVRLGNANITLFDCMVGYTQQSDRRVKNNITYNEVKGLEFINKLRPVVYNLDTRRLTEFMAKNQSPERKAIYMDQDFGPPTAIRRSGFIAQEVEKAAADCGYDFCGVRIPKSEDGAYGLRYSAFVVPLVKAMQEQQVMITDMQADLENIRKAAGSTGIRGNVLQGFGMEANRPNPFKDETIINYNVPASVSTAYLVITDLSGKQIVSYPVTTSGPSSITVTSEKLSPGIYIYSIVGDNQVLGTKKMVVSSK